MTLWEPVMIRGLRLENRLVMLATHLGYCKEDGFVTDRLLAFYRERAKNRPGLIIVGGCYTEHLGMSSPTMIGISKDAHMEGLRTLTEMIHSYNVPVAAQLYHAGRYAHSLILGEQAVSASPVKCRLTRETPRELTVKEVHHTIDNFGKAAKRAKEAGFDAVEILGSAGYIINQFLAPATNKRNDEYGGGLENRSRFPIEIIKCVKSAAGSDFPVLYRMSGADFVADGLTLEDNKVLAPMLVQAGIDCLDVTGGWHETRVPQITMNVPRGHYSYLAEALAEVIDIPVVACNRISSVSIAEHILSRSRVRLIGMSRAFLADPRFPELAREKKQNLIRPCIACNQGCLDRVFLLEPVACAINPFAGFEGEKSIGPSGTGKIAVVGGGPAGMEASRILALRGYKVTLFEESKRLGGLLNLAAKVPGRGEFAAYVSYMEKELKRLGIEINLNYSVTSEILTAGNYDGVVCATGTVAGAPPVEGVEGSQVTTAYDVLSLDLDDLGTVAIIGGSALGCYTALALASRADLVRVFEADEMIGMDLGRTSRWVILQLLKDRNVELNVNSKVIELDSKRIVVLKDGKYNHERVTTVVLATSPQPRDRLITQLRNKGIRVEAVGSAVNCMNLLDIIHSTFNAINNLEI
jgi:2,4-dienoyl-CoA reductase (NADPH2)